MLKSLSLIALALGAYTASAAPTVWKPVVCRPVHIGITSEPGAEQLLCNIGEVADLVGFNSLRDCFSADGHLIDWPVTGGKKAIVRIQPIALKTVGEKCTLPQNLNVSEECGTGQVILSVSPGHVTCTGVPIDPIEL